MKEIKSLSLIKFVDVVKKYSAGDTILFALDHVNLSIEKGELVALMGKSGAGKSTAANIIGLLDDPTSGQYFLDEIDASHLSLDQQAEIRNQKIGFVFQSFFLLSRLKSWENISLPLLYRGFSQKEAKKKSCDLLARLGVPELADKRPNQMSGGQQQRVAIARALVGEPAVIIADEPTGALDMNTSKQIMQLFSSLHKEKNITVIIVTHDPAVGAQCKRILVMVDGKVAVDKINEKPGSESAGMVSNLLVNAMLPSDDPKQTKESH